MTENKMIVQTDENIEALRTISSQDFLTFGLNHVAYIKPITLKGGPAWSIHAADGRPLSVMATAEEALVASWQNDLKPVRLH